MIEQKPLCKVGDKFYRIVKGEIKLGIIIRAERMPLGHYVYGDDIKGTEISFNRNFFKKYFKDKELAEEKIRIESTISEIRQTLKEYQEQLEDIIAENEKQIKEEMKDE